MVGAASAGAGAAASAGVSVFEQATITGSSNDNIRA
jgi:hypothetical protein